jgi:hypothetical protein
MPKPICVKCQRFYRPKKTGFYLIEGMPLGDNVVPGTEEAHLWKPYKLWSADKWQCQGCGHEMISGFAREPIAEQYDPRFDEIIKAFGATYQVNDC